jgi:pilus assembly protein CpaF
MNEQNSDDLLAPWLNDPTVSEILVDGYQRFYFEKAGKLVDVESPFPDNDHLLSYVTKLAAAHGQKLNAAHPMVDLNLERSRATVVIPPVSTIGPVLVIRKFTKHTFTFDDLVKGEALSGQMETFLKACIEGRLNILVAGGTGSGKTTILNTLANTIPVDERLILVQNVEELDLSGHRLVSLVEKPASPESEAITVKDLIFQALKMRPERIIINEFRGDEIVAMLEAVNTGHDGSMGTIHATSPREALNRLETMVAVAQPSMPLLTIRERLSWGFDLIVQCQRLPDGVRRIVAITEVQGLVGDSTALQDVFVYRESGQDAGGKPQGQFEATGHRPQFSKRLSDRNLNLPQDFFAA